MRRQAKSYLPFVFLVVVAWIAFQIGSTLGAIITIFAVIVWACAALMIVYMLLFRGVKFTLFADESVAEIIYVDETGALSQQREPVIVDQVVPEGVTPVRMPVAVNVDAENGNDHTGDTETSAQPAAPSRPGTAVATTNQA